MTLRRSSMKHDLSSRVAAAAAGGGGGAALKSTGAMVALKPDRATAVRLAYPGYEPEDDLHVTLAFLGRAEDWSLDQQLSVVNVASHLANTAERSVVGRLWAAGSFNPYGADPCAALLVGDNQDLVRTHQEISALIAGIDAPVPEQHRPWIPHITLGYGLPVTSIVGRATGSPVHFDRLRVTFGAADHDFTLP